MRGYARSSTLTINGSVIIIFVIMGNLDNIYARLAPVAIIFILIEIGLSWYYKKDLIMETSHIS